MYSTSLGHFSSDFISTPQRVYSLSPHWCTELINWQCHHCPHCTIFYFFRMIGQWKWTCPRPPLWQLQVGFEPMIFWSLVWNLNQLCYIGHRYIYIKLCIISVVKGDNYLHQTMVFFKTENNAYYFLIQWISILYFEMMRSPF